LLKLNLYSNYNKNEFYLFLLQGSGPLSEDFSEQKLTHCTHPRPHEPHYCPNGHPPFCALACDLKIENFVWSGHTENKGMCMGHRPVNVTMADRDLKVIKQRFAKLNNCQHSPLNLVPRLRNYSEEAIKAIKGGQPILRDRVNHPPSYRAKPVTEEVPYSHAVQNFPSLPSVAKLEPGVQNESKN